MKNWIPLMLLLCLLSGCAGAPRSDPAPPAAPQPAVQEEAGGLRAALLEEAARPLSEEEILDAYDQAVTVYGWFDLAPLPNDGRISVVDGTVYRHVDMHDIQTLEDLRTCLRSVFSQELTERLLSAGGEIPRYREIDGALYVTGERRSPDPGKGEADIQVERTGDASYSVNVAVDLMDEDGESITGLECWAFPYVFEEDRWVFTDFRLVY